jgi:hypothetical protein
MLVANHSPSIVAQSSVANRKGTPHGTGRCRDRRDDRHARHTAETTHTTAYDVFSIQVVTPSGTHTLATHSNLNAALGYQHHTFDLMPYLGQVVTLQFVGTEDASLQTSFVVDDVTLEVS